MQRESFITKYFLSLLKAQVFLIFVKLFFLKYFTDIYSVIFDTVYPTNSSGYDVFL